MSPQATSRTFRLLRVSFPSASITFVNSMLHSTRSRPRLVPPTFSVGGGDPSPHEAPRPCSCQSGLSVWLPLWRGRPVTLRPQLPARPPHKKKKRHHGIIGDSP